MTEKNIEERLADLLRTPEVDEWASLRAIAYALVLGLPIEQRARIVSQALGLDGGDETED